MRIYVEPSIYNYQQQLHLEIRQMKTGLDTVFSGMSIKRYLHDFSYS